MRAHEFDVGYWILDDQLVDSEGRRCGRVDDVELTGGLGKPTTISAILTGPGAYRRRLPRSLRRVADRILTDREIAIPWRQVKDIDTVVKLKRPGAELGLGQGDDEAGKFVSKLPGSG